MRGSLNLILESHQPQTQEKDIYHTYEKNSDTVPPLTLCFAAERTLVGWTDRQRNEQVMKPKKEMVLMEGSNKVQELEENKENEGVGKRGREREREIIIEVLINRNHTV